MLLADSMRINQKWLHKGYIWIVLRWDTIQLENVHQIIKLPMYISTYCELLAL
jgi:hypothetical protein